MLPSFGRNGVRRTEKADENGHCSGGGRGPQLNNGDAFDINIKAVAVQSSITAGTEDGDVRRQVVVIWDLEDDPDGNYVHIVVEHGVTQDEVDDVVSDPTNATADSDSSGRPITFGWTRTGRRLAVIWE